MSSAGLIPEYLDPLRHGRSVERISLDAPEHVGGLFDGLPPVGVPFVEVIATADGHVLLVGGSALFDNHVERRVLLRLTQACAPAIAAAIIRAIGVSFGGSSARILPSAQSNAALHAEAPAHSHGDAP